MLINKIKGYAKRVYFKSQLAIKNKLYKPNKDALLVFGFQKTGSTAIAGLLAKRTGKSVTLDTKYLWTPYYENIIDGEMSLKYVIEKYSYPFSKEIIKEPQLTFLTDELSTIFAMNSYIFIVRNPFENIRSILNRLDLPGDKNKINLEKVNKNWQYIFRESNGQKYIEDLANRWILANNRKSFVISDKCILVKYEDFKNDKYGTIDRIAMKLDYPLKKDISSMVDYQFQPKGNRKIKVHDFFGERNYMLIKKKCNELIDFYNY